MAIYNQVLDAKNSEIVVRCEEYGMGLFPPIYEVILRLSKWKRDMVREQREWIVFASTSREKAIEFAVGLVFNLKEKGLTAEVEDWDKFVEGLPYPSKTTPLEIVPHDLSPAEIA